LTIAFFYPKMKAMKKRAGFTLLELLIVIAIIGVLASLVAVSYSSAQRRARDSQRQSDLKAIQNALEQYYADNDGNYPDDDTENNCVVIGDAVDSSGNHYLPGEALPTDPKTGESYIFGTCNNSQYKYCADLEADGSFDGTEEDFCVANLQ
jgi:general secretion pathway protein G